MDSKIFRYWGYTTNFFQSLFLLAVRLYWGFLFFYAGLGKFANMSQVVAFFNHLGLAGIFAYLVAIGEFVCGILLFFGLISRLAAACTTCIMLGAYLIAHPENFYSFFSHPPYFFMAPVFSFFIASLIVLFFGPGLFSIDALIKGHLMRKEEKSHNDHSEDDHQDDHK